MKSKISNLLFLVCAMFAVSAPANSGLDMTLHEADDLVGEVFLQENHSAAPELLKGAYRNVLLSTQTYGDSFRSWTLNELGQRVFKTLPSIRTWWLDRGSDSDAMEIGDYVDVNGDGLVDFVMSFYQNDQTYYRATFLNSGSGDWAMIACESSVNWPARFPPCE